MLKNLTYGKHQIMPGEHRFFSGDNFLFGVKRKKEGWIILHPVDNIDEAEKSGFSSGEYYQTGKSNSLLIQPSLPDKPLIFKGSRLHVSSGQKLTFYLKFPLKIQLYFSRKQPENLLKEFATQRLSDSWFGEPYSGEPSYVLGSEFFLSTAEIVPSPLEAICPVTIFNNSPAVLEVERQKIRVENMSLYMNGGKIITSLLSVEYRGKEIISSASYSYSKNFHDEKPELLAKPYGEGSKHLLKLNFHFIRNIYNNEL